MKEHVIRTCFMKEHVISVEEVSCYAGAMHQPLTMPNQRNCVCKVANTQSLQISHKCEGHSTRFFMGYAPILA